MYIYVQTKFARTVLMNLHTLLPAIFDSIHTNTRAAGHVLQLFNLFETMFEILIQIDVCSIWPDSMFYAT